MSGVSRVATVADGINGIAIPKGTVIFVSIVAINFDEELWGSDVDTFNPERWKKLPETVPNYGYLTFLQGRRSCIGRKFAEMELKVLLIKLIQKLRFDEVVKNRHIEKKYITTRPKDGMFLKISTV